MQMISYNGFQISSSCQLHFESCNLHRPTRRVNNNHTLLLSGLIKVLYFKCMDICACCLNRDSILDLQSSSIGFSVSLRHIKLSARPAVHYEALNYMWGPLNPPRHIFVNGQTLNMRQNLYSALKQYRLEVFQKLLYAKLLGSTLDHSRNRAGRR